MLLQHLRLLSVTGLGTRLKCISILFGRVLLTVPSLRLRVQSASAWEEMSHEEENEFEGVHADVSESIKVSELLPTSIESVAAQTEPMRALLDQFTTEQMERFEKFRSSSLAKAQVKKLMARAIGGAVTDNMLIVMSGVTKVWVGELVEEAVCVRRERGDEGPLAPPHLREAHRRLRARGKVPYLRARRRPFRR